MKKSALIFLFTLCFAGLQAQDFLVSFAGTGAATGVDSVKVENITQCTSLKLAGADTLQLSATAGVAGLNGRKADLLLVYPDPFRGSGNIEFESPAAGDATIELCDLQGKQLLRESITVQRGWSRFRLSGIAKGEFLVQVRGKTTFLQGKLISLGAAGGSPAISFAGYGTDHQTKRTSSIIPMQYNAADQLKITGISGIYRTVVMLVPAGSQTVTFSFVDCTDADGNHYAVVQIGTQLWMEENLKTTKYQDGSPIPNITDSSSWRYATAGAWCNYHNDSMEGVNYGHLYNGYAVQDSRNLSPAGWHVPGDAEWRTLENFLGDSLVAGQKMKENCTTRWAYNDTTWGTNTSGFTGLCSNYRNAAGGWSLAPNNDHDANFWSSTVYVTNFIWFRGLRWCYNDVFRAPSVPAPGFSVRCIK